MRPGFKYSYDRFATFCLAAAADLHCLLHAPLVPRGQQQLVGQQALVELLLGAAGRAAQLRQQPLGGGDGGLARVAVLGRQGVVGLLALALAVQADLDHVVHRLLPPLRVAPRRVELVQGLRAAKKQRSTKETRIRARREGKFGIPPRATPRTRRGARITFQVIRYRVAVGQQQAGRKTSASLGQRQVSPALASEARHAAAGKALRNGFLDLRHAHIKHPAETRHATPGRHDFLAQKRNKHARKALEPPPPPRLQRAARHDRAVQPAGGPACRRPGSGSQSGERWRRWTRLDVHDGRQTTCAGRGRAGRRGAGGVRGVRRAPGPAAGRPRRQPRRALAAGAVHHLRRPVVRRQGRLPRHRLAARRRAESRAEPSRAEAARQAGPPAGPEAGVRHLRRPVVPLGAGHGARAVHVPRGRGAVRLRAALLVPQAAAAARRPGRRRRRRRHHRHPAASQGQLDLRPLPTRVLRPRPGRRRAGRAQPAQLGAHPAGGARRRPRGRPAVRGAPPQRRRHAHLGRLQRREQLRRDPLDGGRVPQARRRQRVPVRRRPRRRERGPHRGPLHRQQRRDGGQPERARGRVGLADGAGALQAPGPRGGARHRAPRLQAQDAVQQRGAAGAAGARHARLPRRHHLPARAGPELRPPELPRQRLGQGQVRQGRRVPEHPAPHRGPAGGAARPVREHAAPHQAGRQVQPGQDVPVRGRRPGQGRLHGRRRQPAGVPPDPGRRRALRLRRHRVLGHRLRHGGRARRLRRRGHVPDVDRGDPGAVQRGPAVLVVTRVPTMKRRRDCASVLAWEPLPEYHENSPRQ